MARMNIAAIVVILDGLTFSYRQSAVVSMYQQHNIQLIFENSDRSLFQNQDRLYLHFEPEGVYFTRKNKPDGIYLNATFLESRRFRLYREDELIFEFQGTSNAADLERSAMDDVNYTLIAERSPNALENGKLKSSHSFPLSFSMIDANGLPSRDACFLLSFTYPIEIILSEYDSSLEKCVVTIAVQLDGFQSTIKLQPYYNGVAFDEEHSLQMVQGLTYIANMNTSIAVICMCIALACAGAGLWKLRRILQGK